MPIYLEDKQLTRRLLAGDERAFSQFFDDNFSRLYRFALARLSGDEEAARDITQSTLSRAVRKIHLYRGEAALFTWICVICRHEISDWWKKQSHYREHVVLTEDYPDIRAVIEALDTPLESNPQKIYQHHEAARLIQVALDRLPRKYGDALEWKYIEGHSVKEIAKRLNLSPVAAQSMLARAKRSFQDIYSTLAQAAFNENTAQ
jgi:RNA polymerase sigma-70 factor (ECF subfamily)